MIIKSFPTREAYGLQLQPVVESLFSNDEGLTDDFSYVNNILSCENTVEDATIEDIKAHIDTLDLSDSMDQLDAVTTIYSVIETARDYWVEKKSIYGDLLTNVATLYEDVVNFYMNYSGSEKPEDAVNVETIQAVKDMASLGRQAPIFYQHYPEIYVSRLLLKK